MFEMTLNKGKILDSKLQQRTMKKRKIWTQVLTRLLDVVTFLTKQNLPFRAPREDVHSSNKGNFMELVELMNKYDLILGKYYLKEINGSITCNRKSKMNSFIYWKITRKKKYTGPNWEGQLFCDHTR